MHFLPQQRDHENIPATRRMKMPAHLPPRFLPNEDEIRTITPTDEKRPKDKSN
jgi:hypothetical protein